MHDDAKPGDLEDMVEAIGAAVRKRYNDRVSHGQPFVALELWHRPSEVGMQSTLCLVCEAQMARTLEGIIAGAYPDVRLGRTFEEEPHPISAELGEPRYVMRFRKRRPFIYPLGNPAPGAVQRHGKGTPLIEAIAMTQTALATESLVRFQIMPATEQLEDRARRRLEEHERRHHGHHHHGGRGTTILDQAEMRSAVEIRHRSMFYLEVQVGSSDWETCNRIAASLVARRGENHLHRRYMVIRQRMYCRRFPRAYPPLFPPLSMRSLVSGVELAHLLELPSARLKGVPIRRLTIPRMPAPPNAGRARAPVLPVLRADNAEVLIEPEDRKYGALLVGSMGSGKTAALLRMVLNDVREADTAPIIIDPKSELSRLCLGLIPPDCGKRVWFLDLGRPAFGISPLRRAGERPLAIEAAAIAENVVAALSDISENQIFQSSRRDLYHAVIGALALAQREGRRPKFEDVYSLLRPAKNDVRDKVAEACADEPDLDQTAEFFRSELPDDLKMASASVAQRLDAPRNKISGLTGVPPLRRFFNHPTDIPLREIIEARDVLIVDANMAAIGTENSRACMHFLLRMLHTQLQRQVHLPEAERPRVPLIVDEAHYVADGENVVDQIATHRAAGLEVAFGLQYFAQLGSGSAHEEKIRKGVINLLQSRFLFRIGDARDAEEATRIAMAVYATMIRDDPDARARMRVTPEQLLNFPNYYCLASWIGGGTRIPSFIGQTYRWPPTTDEWSRRHLERMREHVGPYPEELASTLRADSADPQPNGTNGPGPETSSATKHVDARARVRPEAPSPDPARAPAAAGRPKREVVVDIEQPAPLPNLADSPVRRVVGKPTSLTTDRGEDGPAPDSVRELAFFDRINDVGEPDELKGVDRLPRLYGTDYAILKLLDRAGLAPRALIGRATLPEHSPAAVKARLVKLYRHGLIAQHPIGVRQRTREDGGLPVLYSLTRRGLQVAQSRRPPAISSKREWRPIEVRHAMRVPHDLHALSWAVACHRAVGDLATDNWRTPRYVTGRFPVPQAGSGARRHPITINEIPVPEGQAIIDVALSKFGEIKPDLSLELKIEMIKLTFDLLVEIDLTERPAYNRDKLLAYDAFLCGWCLEHPRYKTLATRPVVLFVCRDERALLGCAKAADEALVGRIGVMGTPAEQWYYASREHTFFALETDVHRHRLTALALPVLPPDLRERLSGDRDLALETVGLLPESIVAKAGGKS